MRQKRAKAYKKQMTVYTHTFKFREPYQTIVDAELVLNCDSAKFDIKKGLNRTIQGETKPMITQCCMHALYESKNQYAIDTAKGFERRRCNHREPIPPKECIESITIIDGENKHRYIVAAQDVETRKVLRKVPGIPLVFMNRLVMVMEPLSHASARYTTDFERKKLTLGLNNAKTAGIQQLSALVSESAVSNKESKPTSSNSSKRKGPKEPNPLSMKKKKVDQPRPEPKVKKTRRKTKSSKKEDTEGGVECEDSEQGQLRSESVAVTEADGVLKSSGEIDEEEESTSSN